MSLSKDQWGQVEEQLKGPYGRVKLSMQGRELHLEKRFVKENRLAILVFIDGSINAGWGFPGLDSFDEFVKQVWRERSKSVYSPKKQAKIIKDFGKRKAKKFFPKLDEKLTYWVPDFSTVASLRRKLQKLDALEVISIGYQPNAAET